MAKKLKHVRFGIIGLGMMGGCHAEIMSNDKDRRFSFTAVADIDADRAKTFGEKYDVASFTSGEEMIDSGLCDAVIVATPHYWHGGRWETDSTSRSRLQRVLLFRGKVL